MIDERSAVHPPAILNGCLILKPRKRPSKCLVRDVTAKGALLIVPPELEVPEQFELLIRGRGEKRQCRVIWRDGVGLGVQFS
jgi:hypothetical protein